jgi:DHA1 family tetracycline resistance protein-like MFS transporter
LEERLGFDDKDVATLFLIMGVLGIFVQGVVLKLLNDSIGERKVVMFCFMLGAVHNCLYGLAKDKQTIFIAVAIGAFVSMAFPTISAIKSNSKSVLHAQAHILGRRIAPLLTLVHALPPFADVDESEQGRIQGALYSLSALASALGPMTLRFVYHFTKDGAFVGPGSMFIFAAGLYVIASYCAYLLPVRYVLLL